MRRKQGPSKGKTKRRITLIGLVAVLLFVSVMFLVMEHSAVHAKDNQPEKQRHPIPERKLGIPHQDWVAPVQLDNPQNLFGPENAPVPAVAVVAEPPVVQIAAEPPVVKIATEAPVVEVVVEKELVEYFPDEDILFPVPAGVEASQRWRYSSKDLHWKKKDTLFRKFAHYNQTLELPPPSVKREIDRVCSVLLSKGREKLCTLFSNCYPNTLSTTTSMLHDGTTYVITGDIPLMWLRDSSAQVFQYLPLLGKDPYIEVIFEGLIRRQIQWIKLDPYGSSYRLKLDFEDRGKTELTDWDFKTGRTIHVAMHDYEVDSLCSFLKLSYVYYKATGEFRIFESEWLATAKRIVELWILEQDHSKSSYSYPILSHGGKGSPVCYTGMTWSGFRPSDDPCKYGYLIPSNMYAVVTLGYLEEILRDHYPKEAQFLKTVQSLKSQIDEGIHKFGLMKIGEDTVYAYEVDGCGNQYFMDDANVPSLLSIDYLGYKSSRDPSGRIARNTRKHILSEANPFYFRGTAASGIGSPHTSNSHIWPMSLIMQAYTSESVEEINQLLNWIETTDNDTGFMHESFHSQNPSRYTREWFSWANSLFAELVLKHLDKVEAQ